MRWITYWPLWYRKLLRAFVAILFLAIVGLAVVNGLTGKPVSPVLVLIPFWGAVFWLLRLVIRFNQRYIGRALDEVSKRDRE
jgi:hypothetical protein